MITGKKRSEKEYRKLDILSASDLRSYATKDRRTFFKENILKQKDEDEELSRATRIGVAVHCLRLEPEEFDNKFFMSICADPPTGNMKKFVDNLYKETLRNTDSDGVVQLEFTELAKSAYKISGIKKPLFEGFIKDFEGKDGEMYYRERRACESTGKELMCTEDRNIADRVVETLINHEHTKHIFVDSEKEVQIDNFEIDGLPLKSMLDDVKIEGDTITGTDLKVTWTNEDFFVEHFLKRRADIQAYVYVEALKSKYPGYKINPFRFVVADSTNFNAPLVYEIGKSWKEKTYYGFEYQGRRYKGLQHIIEEIKWHNSTGNWGVSKQAAANLGIIKLE